MWTLARFYVCNGAGLQKLLSWPFWLERILIPFIKPALRLVSWSTMNEACTRYRPLPKSHFPVFCSLAGGQFQGRHGRSVWSPGLAPPCRHSADMADGDLQTGKIWSAEPPPDTHGQLCSAPSYSCWFLLDSVQDRALSCPLMGHCLLSPHPHQFISTTRIPFVLRNNHLILRKFSDALVWKAFIFCFITYCHLFVTLDPWPQQL